jgi:hypothetical protein
MEHANGEQLIAAIREQIANAHGLVEAGGEASDDEIIRLCRQLSRIEGIKSSEAARKVVKEAVECMGEIREHKDACGMSADHVHGFGRVILQNLGRAVPTTAAASLTPGACRRAANLSYYQNVRLPP